MASTRLGPLLLAAALLLTLSPADAAAPASDTQPGLGSPGHLAPLAKGYGKVAPRYLNNGGDPSGEVARLAWKHWGGATAKGRGVTWLLRPEGGFFARPGRIVLRASGLGTCPDGTRAYTHLEYRIAPRPGAPVGHRWGLWEGDGDIC